MNRDTESIVQKNIFFFFQVQVLFLRSTEYRLEPVVNVIEYIICYRSFGSIKIFFTFDQNETQSDLTSCK